MFLFFGNGLVPFEVGKGSLVNDDQAVDPVLECFFVEVDITAFFFNYSGLILKII